MGLGVGVDAAVVAALLLRFPTKRRVELVCRRCGGWRTRRAAPSASRELTELTREAGAEAYGRADGGARRGDKGAAISYMKEVRLHNCEPGALAVVIIVAAVALRRRGSGVSIAANRITGALLESWLTRGTGGGHCRRSEEPLSLLPLRLLHVESTREVELLCSPI